MTRCKFRLNSVTRDMDGSKVVRDAEGKPVKDERGYEKRIACERRTLKFSPVYGNNNPEHENTKFWEASPSGSFELSCVNLAAVEHMEPGKEYYIDITPAQ